MVWNSENVQNYGHQPFQANTSEMASLMYTIGVKVYCQTPPIVQFVLLSDIE